MALKNKNAWMDESFSEDEIIFDSKKNKLMAYPYNKLHCTSWNVNQSAALIICSEKIADKLMIETSQRVYPIASTENNHMISVQQRPKLYESFGMNYAAKMIRSYIKKLGISIDAYDLYSCFPAAVRMFKDSLKIEDGEPLTVTGSMPFAGGPLNSYVLHSSVEMIKKIRANEISYGLVTGVSGMMTKQSFCVWGNKYKEGFFHSDVTKKVISKESPFNLSSKLNGDGKIIGYTFFENNNQNMIAVLYLEDEDCHRKVVTSNKQEFINVLKNEEWVGKRIKFQRNQVVSW